MDSMMKYVARVTAGQKLTGIMVYKPDKANVPPAESCRRNSALCNGDGMFLPSGGIMGLSLYAFGGAECQFELELALRTDRI